MTARGPVARSSGRHRLSASTTFSKLRGVRTVSLARISYAQVDRLQRAAAKLAHENRLLRRVHDALGADVATLSVETNKSKYILKLNDTKRFGDFFISRRYCEKRRSPSKSRGQRPKFERGRGALKVLQVCLNQRLFPRRLHSSTWICSRRAHGGSAAGARAENGDLTNVDLARTGAHKAPAPWHRLAGACGTRAVAQ